ncbi:MAG: condensation domain-containing protein, partial [Calditrichota bacterium]
MFENNKPNSPQVFWTKYLNGVTLPKPLHSSLGSNGHDATIEYKAYSINLSKEETKVINDLIKKNSIDLLTCALGAWAILLQRYQNVNDLVIGLKYENNNRSSQRTINGSNKIISTLPFRIKIPRRKTAEVFLRKVHENCKIIQGYVNTSLADIREWIGTHNFFFDSILAIKNHDNIDDKRIHRSGIGNTSTEIDDSKESPIELYIENSIEIGITFRYKSMLFDGRAIANMANELKSTLINISRLPEMRIDHLNILSPAEQKMMAEWNDTQL